MMARQKNKANQDSGASSPPPVNLNLISPVEPLNPGPISPLLEPPDGGLKAWTQAVMGHLVAFNTCGYIASFGVFQAYYQSALGVSPSAISWVGSVQIFLIFSSAPSPVAPWTQAFSHDLLQRRALAAVRCFYDLTRHWILATVSRSSRVHRSG